jgi:hypothetical protein
MAKLTIFALIAMFANSIFTGGCAPDHQSDNNQKLRVAVVVTNNPQSPVSILGLKTEPAQADLAVIIKNESSKVVEAVRVEAATATPDGCSPIRHPPIVSTQSDGGRDSLDARFEIPPHGTAKLRAVGLHSQAWQASALQSLYLQIQLGVTKVEFSDGTSWSRGDTGVFDPKLLESDALNCRGSSFPTQPLDTLETVTISPPANLHSGAEGGLESRHTFFCEIVGKTAQCGT